MFNKHRILDEKSGFSLPYLVLFSVLALSLFVSVAERAYGQQPTATPIPNVGCLPNKALRDTGCWTPAFSSGQVVHATVLPNGHLLNWSSFPTHGYARLWECNLAGTAADKKLCALHNVNQDWWTNTLGGAPGLNVFCSGHSLMSNGLVLVTGGVHPDINIYGESRTATFNYNKAVPGQEPWELGATMSKGRWYPTNVALGNGETLVASGLYRQGAGDIVNNIPEVFPAPTPTPSSSPAPTPAPPRQLTGAQNIQLPLYPWLYYASNGKVFYAGPTDQAHWLNTAGSGSWDPVPSPAPSPDPLRSSTYREAGSSVMYDVDKVMISGGGAVSPVNTNEVIDLSSAVPDWRAVAPMAFARKHHNLTILADGKILATGGTKGIGFNNNCERQVVYEAELWTPPTTATGLGSWSTMAKMSHNRRYHSTAVLLRDGRVMVGGSDLYPSTPAQCFPPLQTVYQTEIFTPPYLFDQDTGALAARPKVTTVPGGGTPGSFNISYASQFNVGMTDSTAISKVTFIRLSSVTHSFNMNQRINYLPVQQNGSNLTITAPANSNVAPPGHYLMFIINSSGVPSVGEIVRIS